MRLSSPERMLRELAKSGIATRPEEGKYALCDPGRRSKRSWLGSQEHVVLKASKETFPKVALSCRQGSHRSHKTVAEVDWYWSSRINPESTQDDKCDVKPTGTTSNG